MTISILIPHLVVNSESLSPEEDGFLEDYFDEALAFSQHTIDLKFDEETLKPERAIGAPRNAGIDPSTTKYEATVPETSSRDCSAASIGTDRASYRAREPIEETMRGLR